MLTAAGSAHSAFDFLGKLGHQQAPGHQVPPHVTAETASVTRRGLHPVLSPRGKSSPPGKSPLHFTHPPSLHIPVISALLPTKRPRVEGDFVFITPYQRCDAPLLKTFLCSDMVCLPTEDYETTFNQRAPSLPRMAFQDQRAES